MTEWTPLLVAGPLVAAALITALHRVAGPVFVDLMAGGTAIATSLGAFALTLAAREGPVVVWLGGWTPREGATFGVAFVADVLGAGFACLIATLIVVVLIFARLYYGALIGLFQALLMIFLGAAVGYCLTGDFFNLYVFFELVGVTAFVLTAYRMEEDALHGAMTFAVVNSLASILLLTGIGVLYAAAGTVNLLELGRVLGGELGPRPDAGAVRLAFVLVAAGFLIKSAVVPFHFWLADAYAGAAAPVCVLFGGASVTLGIFGAARVGATVFGLDALPPGMLAALFWPLGLFTAVFAGLMALVEPNLKRVLALTTVSHVGVLLVALGASSPDALAGGAAYLLGHAFVKAGLFVAAGIVVLRLGTAETGSPAGRRGSLVPAALLLAIGGLMLADLPASAIHEGKGVITNVVGDAWHGVLARGLTVAAVLSGAAVLGIALRIGGPGGSTAEPAAAGGWVHGAMAALAGLLLVAAVAAAAPALMAELERGALHFVRTADHAATVLDGAPFEPSPLGRVEFHMAAGDFAAPLAAVGLAVLLWGLPRLPGPLRLPVESLLAAARALHRLHTGHVGDYVAWTVAGVCAIGLAVAALGTLA